MLDRLSGRQRECLTLVGDGYTSKEIARKLSISPSTVDNHINSAIHLTGAANRAEAARMLKQIAHRQALPRQPQTLLKPEKTGTDEAVDRPAVWTQFLKLPPFRGTADNMSGRLRTFHIVQLAIVSSIAVLAIALIMAGAMHILS